VNTDDYTGFLASESPHGATVRIFVNDRALDAIARENFSGTLPPGSLIVKEGYGGTPDAPGDLTAITLMYKVDGFNPDANDWFWAGLSADGSAINAEGAVEMCSACHGQDGNSDYLLRFKLPEGMAVEPTPVALDANALINERCTVCHTRERIDNKKAGGADRAAWEQTVDRMIGRGAQLNDAEREAVLSFLAGE
jgi:mono/diheme cytochrome c family protein